jgi:hypothetical protein
MSAAAQDHIHILASCRCAYRLRGHELSAIDHPKFRILHHGGTAHCVWFDILQKASSCIFFMYRSLGLSRVYNPQPINSTRRGANTGLGAADSDTACSKRGLRNRAGSSGPGNGRREGCGPGVPQRWATRCSRALGFDFFVISLRGRRYGSLDSSGRRYGGLRIGANLRRWCRGSGGAAITLLPCCF